MRWLSWSTCGFLALSVLVVAPSCGGSAQNNGFGGGDGGSSGSSGGGSGGGSGGSGGSSGGMFGGDDGSSGEGGFVGDPVTCAQAAQSQSYIGCDYWPTVTANNVWGIFDFAVVVANAGMQAANITITGPANTNQTGTVAPQSLTKFYLPWVSVLKGPDADECGSAKPLASSVLARGAAYHLQSSVPVTVYQFSALEYQGMGGPQGKDWSQCPGTAVPCIQTGGPIGCFSFSNDASLLLPSTAMTGNYRVTGHGGWGPAMMGSYATVTATAANTTVTVHVSKTGQVTAGGGIAATANGGTLTLQMGAGDVAELVGDPADASDLSGTLIQASNPVQVITGLPCLDVPDTAPACDHVEESNLPAETLGKDYIVSQPTGPHGAVVGQLVRIYGNFDNTQLTYSSQPSGCPTTINAGQVADCGIVAQDFEVKGSNSFAVGVFSQGASVVDPATQPPNQEGDPDESMMVAVPQYRTKYVFLAPTDYTENYVVVTAPTGAVISLDGTNVTATPAPVGSTGYGIVRVPLGPGQAGAHVLTSSQPVGIQVMGYGSYTSYTYPGGLDLQHISPPPQAQ